MELTLTSRRNVSLRNTIVFGFVVIVMMILSLYLAIELSSGDIKEIALSILFILSPFLIFFVLSSERTWIPILICLALIRDLTLGDFVGGGSVKIGDLFIFVIFSVWILKNFLFRSQTQFLKSSLDMVIVLFLAVHVVSLLWSTDLDFGAVRVLKLIRNFCFYLVMRDLFINDFKNSYNQITLCFIITGIVLLLVHMSVIISLGGISDFQVLYQQDIVKSQDMGALRARATGAGILISGPTAWLTISGVFVFGSLMLTRSKFVKILKIVIIASMFGGAMLTLSRSAIINIGIIMAILLLGSIKLKLRENVSVLLKMAVVISTVGIVFGLTQILFKRMDNMFGDLSWMEREELYITAIEAFFNSPLVGIGVGSNYSWQLLNYDLGNQVSRLVHSLYLTILSETGILGFTIFICMLVFWLKYLWDCMYGLCVEPHIKSICLSLFAFSVGFLIYSMTVGEFENIEPWLIMAVASAVKILYLPSKKSNGRLHEQYS